ncbi:hypothetical protein COA17_07485 [Sphingomonas ginsenosidimutans]|uniref:Uncharacterized protein n=1 Tax=Sphingomonas ginsenosidimutans TaxID=862134 RepID=A0A2A4I195_9SPHN|nr:hypothetical protein [Sphingomonas ginsenosidimutans]PCG09687.1 hypothetical protein COA17_07485 [Sphingomonas ginsenosidimutans]
MTTHLRNVHQWRYGYDLAPSCRLLLLVGCYAGRRYDRRLIAHQQEITMPAKLVAFLWPTPENYARYVAVSDDRMHPTHAAFVAANAPKIEALAARGIIVQRVEFDPDEMAAWCRREFGAVNAEARGAYAATILMQRHESGGQPKH